MSKLPAMSYLSRDFTAIKNELENWVKLNKPELWNDFYESNLGSFLIELIAYHGDMISFAIDRVSEEIFLVNAKHYKSALKHAKMLAYKPSAATAASVTVRADPLPFNIASQGIFVAKGAQLSLGSIIFETNRDYSFPAGSSEIVFGMVEGESTEEEFDSNGEEFIRYTTNTNKVIEGSWEVLVNGVTWDEVEYVELENGATKTYSTEFEGDRSLTIRFGDGNNGAIPTPGGVVTIKYRVGGGVAGNLPTGSVVGTVNATQGGVSVRIGVVNDAPSSGGTDRETIEHIKKWAPLNVRTVDKAISGEDYATEAASFQDPDSGAISRATFSLREGTLLLTRNDWSPGQVVTIPANTDVRIGDGYFFKTLTQMKINGGNPNLVVDPNTVDVWTWAETVDTDGYRTHTTPAEPLRQALLEHLLKRSVVCVMPVVRNGLLFPINIDLGEVIVDRRYLKATVEESIRKVTEEFFMNEDLEPGDSFRLSDYYQEIEKIPGVDHFVIQEPLDDIDVPFNAMIVRGTLTMQMAHAALDVPDSIRGRY